AEEVAVVLTLAGAGRGSHLDASLARRALDAVARVPALVALADADRRVGRGRACRRAQDLARRVALDGLGAAVAAVVRDAVAAVLTVAALGNDLAVRAGRTRELAAAAGGRALAVARA